MVSVWWHFVLRVLLSLTTAAVGCAFNVALSQDGHSGGGAGEQFEARLVTHAFSKLGGETALAAEVTGDVLEQYGFSGRQSESGKMLYLGILLTDLEACLIDRDKGRAGQVVDAVGKLLTDLAAGDEILLGAMKLRADINGGVEWSRIGEEARSGLIQKVVALASDKKAGNFLELGEWLEGIRLLAVKGKRGGQGVQEALGNLIPAAGYFLQRFAGNGDGPQRAGQHLNEIMALSGKQRFELGDYEMLERSAMALRLVVV